MSNMNPVIPWERVEEMKDGAVLTFKRHLTKGDVGDTTFDLSINNSGLYVMLENHVYRVTLEDFVTDAYKKHLQVKSVDTHEKRITK